MILETRKLSSLTNACEYLSLKGFELNEASCRWYRHTEGVKLSAEIKQSSLTRGDYIIMIRSLCDFDDCDTNAITPAREGVNYCKTHAAEWDAQQAELGSSASGAAGASSAAGASGAAGAMLAPVSAPSAETSTPPSGAQMRAIGERMEREDHLAWPDPVDLIAAIGELRAALATHTKDASWFLYLDVSAEDWGLCLERTNETRSSATLRRDSDVERLAYALLAVPS